MVGWKHNLCGNDATTNNNNNNNNINNDDDNVISDGEGKQQFVGGGDGEYHWFAETV